jgi:hypothetical protein
MPKAETLCLLSAVQVDPLVLVGWVIGPTSVLAMNSRSQN